MIQHIKNRHNIQHSEQFSQNGARLLKVVNKSIKNSSFKRSIRDATWDAFKSDCPNLVIICPWLLDVIDTATAGSNPKTLIDKIVDWYDSIMIAAHQNDKV